ncbi:hypothetical protein GCM10011371_04700 [Novosphingobium marinum]|uniref:Phage holin family protein n=1 Tax=Novosphingobium marinum TaxID=1514948 RepID=A0A7Z0BUC6_9SPHN|nr:phage holin family protein [Novosphingobium marinum]NYH94160.1 hypothetical protein [Novosphingobium marinum]GGC20064.1 hypothetical protein GCM10011371_04700 [Novosphingobium marinum]
MNDQSQNFTPPLDEAKERSLNEDVRQLAQDARVLAEAELAYQKSRASYAGQEAKGIAILGASALVLLFFATMALVVGLVLALAPILTAWGSTAVVTGALLLLTAICGLSAAGKYKRMMAMISDKKAE